MSEKSEELEISYVPSLLRDIVIAFEEVESTKGLPFFPADIVVRLCETIKELRLGIARCACSYYKVNDFAPTPYVIDVMRKTVLLATGVI